MAKLLAANLSFSQPSNEYRPKGPVLLAGPALGAGVIVAIIGLSMFGVSGLFDGDWQRREEEKYLRRHGSTETGDDDSTSIPPPP